MNISDRTFHAIQANTFHAQQSENANLPYVIDWATVLGTDTISTSTWAATNATVVDSNTTTTATAKVTGSPGTYILTNKIVTAAGNTDERSIKLTIKRNDTTPVQGDYN